MRTIIAGSRGITSYLSVEEAVNASGFQVTQVVCGMARGVDLLGKEYAEKNGLPVACFPAQWDAYGKRAGYLRNEEMARNAEALIAVWDGNSRGTKHMIDIAIRAGLSTYVHPH